MPKTYECHICGGPLEYFHPAPDIAPWRCPVCLWAWFECELTPKAKSMWRPKYRDFGVQMPLIPLVQEEIVAYEAKFAKEKK